MTKLGAFAVTVVAAGTAAAPATAAAPPAHDARAGATRTYVVLYARGASLAGAHRAIHRAGGRILRENRRIGLATVAARSRGFVRRATAAAAIQGAAANRAIGHLPGLPPWRRIESERGYAATRRTTARAADAPPPAEPLSANQWDMRMMHATPDGSYAVQTGSHAVRVGIIDTGVDGSHPDISPNFDRELSRNFTVDDPVIDGPCEDEPDHSCTDPPDVDEDGHGTHVAGTIGAALNGVGIGGVAPGVDIVNLRAGQDSGFFFLQPTVDALTYAGDNGIDVVNMSFFVDPWLYNCRDNPADSPAEQEQQATIIDATQRALDYARRRGVTLVAALGNENTDLGNPTVDETSPDYPPGTERPRQVDNSCLDMPTEGGGVIAVASIGPSERKAYYSNYGVEQTDVSAPGGDRRDFFGTDRYNAPDNRILAPMPEGVAQAELAADPSNPLIVQDCTGGTCAHYQWLQGTSMASPHAAGVAALIVAEFGKKDPEHGGLTLAPSRVRDILERTAARHACPDPNRFTYPDPDLTPDFTATCEGEAKFNGFYGHGIVDALDAVVG